LISEPTLYLLGQNLEADSGTKAFSLPYTGKAITIVPRGSLHFAVQGSKI
jgi:hypothetical protein